MKLAKLTFTHTDCIDVYRIYRSQMDRFFPNELTERSFILSNCDHPDYDCDVLIYDETEAYPTRLTSGLLQLKELGFDTIFFDHEDMFLYDYPDVDELLSYKRFMADKDYAHIRLIKGGRCLSRRDRTNPTLYRFLKLSPWIFSIQPSFWNIDCLLHILKKNMTCNIWELEELSQKIVKKMSNNFAFSHRNGRRRGQYHFDNDVYPYIATAVGKGKWNFTEYESELRGLLETHGINKNDRGTF
jgi:hypothetical protein